MNNLGQKKIKKLGDDLKWVFQIDVEKDLLGVELESAEKYE